MEPVKRIVEKSGDKWIINKGNPSTRQPSGRQDRAANIRQMPDFREGTLKNNVYRGVFANSG
jgi:hypothetical protein